MKSRLLWAAVVFAAIAGFYFATIRPTLRVPPERSNRQQLNRDFKDFKPPEIALPPLPEVVIATPNLALPARPMPIVAPRHDPVPPPPVVPIQDGATLDFSHGNPPLVKMQGKDKEALERALKEMAEATQNTTFPPTKK